MNQILNKNQGISNSSNTRRGLALFQNTLGKTTKKEKDDIGQHIKSPPEYKSYVPLELTSQLCILHKREI